MKLMEALLIKAKHEKQVSINRRKDCSRQTMEYSIVMKANEL